jgi:hypothetical protein
VSIGPVEYVVLGFPDDRFGGPDVAPAIAALVAAGTVRIVDVLFLRKDGHGRVEVSEFDELDPSLGYAAVDGEAEGLLSDTDALLAGQAMEPGSSALLLLWEDRWAGPLADVVRSAGGGIIGGQRVPPEVVESAFAGLPAGRG